MKIISRRSAGPDDSIYSGGVEIFSLRSRGPAPKRNANRLPTIAADSASTTNESDSASQGKIATNNKGETAMAKVLPGRQLPPDDPMFNEGEEIFASSQRQASPQKTKRVTGFELTVNWGGDNFSLFLTDDDWASVQSGKRRRCEVEEEQFQMDINWHFNSDPDYSLILDYGDPNHLRWLGQISQAQVERQQVTMLVK